MGFFSDIKKNKIQKDVDKLRDFLSQEDIELSNRIFEKSEFLSSLDLQTEKELAKQQALLQAQVDDYDSIIYKKKEELAALNNEIEESIDMFEYGVASPSFDFQTIDEYKTSLKECRDRQKEILKEMTAQANKTSWTVNNSASEGKKMVKSISKLVMRAYNGECDELVRKVSTKNFESSLEKISKNAETISKLGEVIGISVPEEYVELKELEIKLAYSYALKKEEEKERIKELKAQEKEAAKAAKELEEKKKKLEKEKLHHEKALDEIEKRINNAIDEDEIASLLQKKEEIVDVINDVNDSIDGVNDRVANQRAGYVYIISNIGSFGENVYKIGMTRRLDPMERVKELGDASVPFNFDVHAMIFSEDAPALEAALHKEFHNRRVNKINNRREFFRTTLDDIKKCVHDNFDGTVEFFDIPDATQYRETLALEESENYESE